MSRALRWTLLLALAALPGCRLEDHTPRGSRQDQVEIQRLILTYHRSRPRADPAGDPSPGELRVVRMDLRQEGDLATAWVTTRRGSDERKEREDVLEHFVLRRGEGSWRIVNVAVASGRTPAGRASR
ncbi:MAG TPA: hypothetical protein VFY20_09285 [Gemmatimonadales bacterium]|nr:hypothetical protein [Gemmatimonadales bacterium]